MDTRKSKVVASIDVNVHIPKISQSEWISEMIEDHLNCVLCGDRLLFRFKTNFIEQQVIENAHCPSCGVRTRQAKYKLQYTVGRSFSGCVAS